MRTTLIAATALTLSAAALAQGYDSQPVDDGAMVTQPDTTLGATDSSTIYADNDPLVGDLAPDVTMTAPADVDATTDTVVTDGAVAADTMTTANLQTFAGMGGPYEDVYGSAGGGLDLTPRPAGQNYPPCAPGPGDDRCIQLYEPGVRMQLASWNQATGGLADGSATTAMGGPYEPVADDVALADQSVVEPVERISAVDEFDEPAIYDEPVVAAFDDAKVKPIDIAATEEDEPILVTAIETDWAGESDMPPPASAPTGTGLNSTNPSNPSTNPSDYELKMRAEVDDELLDALAAEPI